MRQSHYLLNLIDPQDSYYAQKDEQIKIDARIRLWQHFSDLQDWFQRVLNMEKMWQLGSGFLLNSWPFAHS